MSLGGRGRKHLLCYILDMCMCLLDAAEQGGGARRETAADLDVGVGPGRSQNNVGKLNLS